MNPQHYTVTVDQIMDAPDYWRDLLYHNKILVLKGLVGLTKDQLWDLHKAFGTPWLPGDYRDSCEASSCDTEGKYVTTYSNVGSVERIGDKSLPWHHDIPWHREKRYPIRSLYPTVLSEGASEVTTDFCDADRVWERMAKEHWPELAGADIRIQYWYDASKGATWTPTKTIPLCEKHPHTERWTLCLNSFGPVYEGLEFSTPYTGAWILDCWHGRTRLGLKYLNMLHRLVCTEDNIYKHRWEAGDLVLFDNYSGVFHGRARIGQPNVHREFWRMNLKHYWQQSTGNGGDMGEPGKQFWGIRQSS